MFLVVCPTNRGGIIRLIQTTSSMLDARSPMRAMRLSMVAVPICALLADAHGPALAAGLSDAFRQ
jgi:hypothetical protein